MSTSSVKVLDAFEVEREGEKERFQPFAALPNRSLLYLTLPPPHHSCGQEMIGCCVCRWSCRVVSVVVSCRVVSCRVVSCRVVSLVVSCRWSCRVVGRVVSLVVSCRCHGTGVYNILGILRKGMCIAPKEANGSGTNFGKGRTTLPLPSPPLQFPHTQGPIWLPQSTLQTSRIRASAT
jgi:hypothetical protein